MFRQPDGGERPPHFGAERGGRPLSEGEIELTRDAVGLIMHDVEAELRSGVVEVVVGTADELRHELVRRGRPVFAAASGVYGWVLQNEGGAIGIWHRDDLAWPDLVVSVADVIQEAIIEGPDHYGDAFPMCPVHPNHPMDAQVVGGVASWICPKRAGEPITIGELQAIKPE